MAELVDNRVYVCMSFSVQHENVLEFIILEWVFKRIERRKRENEVITCQLLEKCLKPRKKYWMLMLNYGDDENDDGENIGSGDNFELHSDMTASDMADQVNL